MRSDLQFEIEPNGKLSDIFQLAGIAIFVLIIASINFMNLSTARSMKRAKEVGMRKVVGGQKVQLITQFIGESILISLLAVILSVFIVLAALPYFNSLVDRSLVFDFTDTRLLVSLLLIGLFVGVLSGVYPAFVLTSLNAIRALKSNHTQSRGMSLRKILVIVQFVISIVLITSTGVAIKQVAFLEDSEVGFQREHIVMLPVIGTQIGKNYRTFADEAVSKPGIESVTAVEEVVGAKHQGGSYQFEGMELANLFPRLKVRQDFLKTFNIGLLAGRDYTIDFSGDDSLSLIVNNTLVKSFKWTPEQAIGKPVTFGRFHGQIVGVTNDFNFVSRREPVGPLVMQLNNSADAFKLSIKYLAVRIESNNVQASIASLMHVWKQFLPDRPFEYFFLDNELNNLYKSDAALIRISGAFSVLAVIVACLGLFGLAAFNAEQRKREISIRKVLGSSVQGILLLILRDYLKLLAISIIVACPLAYVAMRHWLDGFAYRIDVPFAEFISASLLIILAAVATVSYRSMAAARSNPVDSLRSE